MQEEIKKRRLTKKEVRLEHIEKWRESGLTMSAYAREAGISEFNLSKWVRSEDKLKNLFKPISLSSSVMIDQNPMIEIAINSQIKIRFLSVVDVALVVTIIKSLMPCN